MGNDGRAQPHIGSWLEDSRSRFLKVGQFADDIEGQNDLYEASLEHATLPPYRKITTDYLSGQQQHTFDELLQAQKEAPYEQLGLEEAKLHDELGAVAVAIEASEQWRRDALAQIFHERDILGELIPDLIPQYSAKADELANVVEAQEMSEETQAMNSRKSLLEKEYAAVNAAYEIAGRGGRGIPIPRLIPTRQPRQPDTPAKEPKQPSVPPQQPSQPNIGMVVDTFPMEPRAYTKAEVAEAIQRRYPEKRMRDASQSTGYILVEAPGLSWPESELAELIYDQDTPNKAERLSALVRNNIAGRTRIIPDMLAEHGLVLQRGTRRVLNESGKKVGREMMYRSMPVSEADKKELVAHTSDPQGNEKIWHTVQWRNAPTTANKGVSATSEGQDMPPSHDNTSGENEPGESQQRQSREQAVSTGKLLARLLVENSGLTLNHLEVGRGIYGDSEAPELLRNRVVSLVESFAKGMSSALGKELATRGHVLQQGVSRYYDKSGKRVGIRHAVIRAVPEAEALPEEQVVHRGGTKDEKIVWRTVTPRERKQINRIIPGQNPPLEPIKAPAQEQPGVPISADDTPVQPPQPNS